ncbi:VapB-type antitoxin [Candidatus Marsarchaeota G2 archaeon OSP_D]|jgi:antitoxin CcdA|uniref:VapB-type antitoxin n=6 Tax=Candidatus Marsarchaeota group 2 TaxID=2203771 RepID=A0A2R6C915_9ARCH|nr:MAG: VapB-type antitoxin [Candidatus Marsarchaeota G2 archaeon OSP_D]PSN95320.1 MAG: VapB-type antitoxin [Candidatus Marsarchaeota G2 archaeon ECH_B_2]PSN99943.1 MAG: VapB-type antitoxin [Candidatus Marsarchaeota G2 archaeon ECH_B_3]PSO02141.1 MAG: VapB-type antitoxin [Candidatus Marsarchaeota G2 archaeon ECH_B_1]PSO07256.1 MAG: VapB-type antitoxin [Candidatus Marsarchaeota G2 archaeon BE_D]
MDWVTVSTKVRRETLEKAKKYKVNVSEILRNALEKEINEREEDAARKSAKKISAELNLSEDEVVRLIKEDRKR